MRKVPDGYRINYEVVETKTRRLQLTVTPTLYERIKAYAEAAGDSVNESVSILLNAALDTSTEENSGK